MNESYIEMKQTTLSLIQSVRAKDMTLADYLERHIRFNDKDQKVEYTGNDSVIQSLMKRAVITD